MLELIFKNKRAMIKLAYLIPLIILVSVLPFVLAGIVYHGTPLLDSTIYNSTANICSASRYGMNISVYPCKADTVVGTDIVQYVDFEWTGASPQNTSWVFVYDQPLKSGKMDVQINETYFYDESYKANAWATDYPVNNIVSMTSLGTPTEFLCQIGNANNTFMYKVNQTTGNSTNSSMVTNYCFTSSTMINSTSYLISGNYWADATRTLNSTRLAWSDITSKITYMGYNLLDDNRSYYEIKNVTFQPNVPIKTKWTYTSFNNSKAGKWHIFGYDSAVNISTAIDSDVYIYLDPWWNAGYNFKAIITIDEGVANSNPNWTFVINHTTLNMSYNGIFGVIYNDTTQLSCEYVNNSNYEMGRDEVWCKSNIAFNNSPDNLLKFYYNKTGTAIGYNPGNVWSGYYNGISDFVLHLNDNLSSKVIDSNNKKNWTIVGTISLNKTNCVYGTCYQRLNQNENANRINFASTLIVNSPYTQATLSLWFKTNTVGGISYGNNIIGRGTQSVNTYYLLAYNSSGHAVGYINNAYMTASSGNILLNDNNWHFMTMRWNTTGTEIDVDAKQQLYVGQNGPNGGGTGGDFLGSAYYTTGAVTNMSIDEITFVGRYIPLSEINQSYMEGKKNYAILGTEQSNSDTTFPLVNITYPTANNQTFFTEIQLNVSASDETALGSCWWTKDFEATNTSLTCGNNITGITWAEGSNYVTFYANDSSNNVNSSSRQFNIDTTNPAINITYPLNTNYSINISTLNYTVSDTNLQACWYSLNSGVTNTSVTCGTNLTGLTSNEGSNTWTVYTNDSGNNKNSSSVTFNKDTTLPNGTLISPSNGTTSYLYSYNFTANVSDTNLANATLFIYNSSNSLINQTFTSLTGITNAIIGTTISLINGVYTWFYQLFDTYNNQALTTNNTLTVNSLTTNISSGYYGYTNNNILNASDISSNIQYGYEIFEITANATLINSSWGNVTNSINQSYLANKKMGINYLLDFNLNDSVSLISFNNNITSNFPLLKTDPYYATIEYISLEISNPSYYNTTQKDSVINSIASTIYSATSNKFVLYSKNYNSTGMDTSYIISTKMIYITAISDADLINQEMGYTKNTTNLNRIYVNPATSQQLITAIYEPQVLKQLRAGLNVSVGYGSVYSASLTNGDLIVFNNNSANSILSVNVTNMTILGKDFWDTTNRLQVSKNFNGELLNVNVSGYSATYVLADDIDNIFMTSNTIATVYKTAATTTSDFNYSDGTRDGSWSLYGANDIRTEVFDASYQKNNFMVYYGWLNASYINFTTSYYPTLILADKNAGELAKVNSSSVKYGYVSVADFVDTGAWVTAKEGEMDSWIALNSTMNIFIDGLDSGTGGTNFSARFKEVVDYVRITKAKKAILNTYTAYESFATWGDGAMKESCVQRWNGASASTPDNYSRENWNLELNKSSWYNSHGVSIYCQAFGNRTTNPYQIENYTQVLDVYYASKVLGYSSFYYTQPDFNYAWTEYLPNTGTSMASVWSTDDNQTYYRRYSNGIVYYNSSSGHGWQDTGSTSNQVQLCFDLYDEHATATSFDFNINHNDITPPTTGNYSISDTSLTVGVWTTVCRSVNASENGRYVIDAFVNPRSTIVGQGISIGYAEVAGQGQHSWWDTTAGAYSWNIYPSGKNWEVDVSSNSTSKVSLDTVSALTASVVNTTYYHHNLTISASSNYNFTIYSSLQQTNTVKTFHNISYYNGSFVNLAASNTSTCDSNNPTMSSTTINSEIYGACYWQNATSIIWRVQAPRLSTQVFQMETDFDIVNPNINLTYPLNVNYSTNITALNYTVSDLNLQVCWYSLNNGVTNVTVTCGTNLTGLTSVEGYNNWTVYANDTYNNLNSSTVTFFKDTTFPLIDWSVGTLNNGVNVSQTNIYMNTTWTETNFNSITFWRDGVSAIYSSPQYDYNATGLTQGTHTYYVTLCDTVGNCNSTSTRTITLDTINPNIDLTYPLSTNYNTNISALNYTVSDTNLKSCWYSINSGVTNTTITCGNNITGLTSVEGSNTWRVYANDTAGNQNVSSITFNKDTILPSINITYPLNNSVITINNITINYTISDTNLQTCWYSNNSGVNNNTISCNNMTSAFWLEGLNTVILYANDSFGNQNSSSVTFTISTSVPSVVVSGGGGTGWITTGTGNNTQQITILSNFSNITLYSMDLKYLGVKSNEGTIRVLTKDMNNQLVDVELITFTIKNSSSLIDYKIERKSIGNYEVRFLTTGILEEILVAVIKTQQLTKEISQEISVDLSTKQTFFSGVLSNASDTGDALKDFLSKNWVPLAVFFFIFFITVALVITISSMKR